MLGGGANPLLDKETITKNNFNYTILDISKKELEKAPTSYSKILGDISSINLQSEKKHNIIFSKMLAEHIVNADQFHLNIFNLLEQDGLAVHFFPTLYTFPFAVNRIFPEKLSAYLLDKFAPRNKVSNAKFPAYYRYCRGPTEKQISYFNNIGYDVLQYNGYFGHSGYYNKLPIIKYLHNYKSKILLKYPNPHFTSFAIIILRKPKL